jgi:transposase
MIAPKRNKDAIKIEYLPKGSPDYNVVEGCWKQGKEG